MLDNGRWTGGRWTGGRWTFGHGRWTWTLDMEDSRCPLLQRWLGLIYTCCLMNLLLSNLILKGYFARPQFTIGSQRFPERLMRPI